MIVDFEEIYFFDFTQKYKDTTYERTCTFQLVHVYLYILNFAWLFFHVFSVGFLFIKISSCLQKLFKVKVRLRPTAALVQQKVFLKGSNHHQNLSPVDHGTALKSFISVQKIHWLPTRLDSFLVFMKVNTPAPVSIWNIGITYNSQFHIRVLRIKLCVWLVNLPPK